MYSKLTAWGKVGWDKKYKKHKSLIFKPFFSTENIFLFQKLSIMTLTFFRFLKATKLLLSPRNFLNSDKCCQSDHECNWLERNMLIQKFLHTHELPPERLSKLPIDCSKLPRRTIYFPLLRSCFIPNPVTLIFFCREIKFSSKIPLRKLNFWNTYCTCAFLVTELGKAYFT